MAYFVSGGSSSSANGPVSNGPVSALGPAGQPPPGEEKAALEVVTRAMWNGMESSGTSGGTSGCPSENSGGEFVFALDPVRRRKTQGIVNKRIGRDELQMWNSSEFTSSEDSRAESKGEVEAKGGDCPQSSIPHLDDKTAPQGPAPGAGAAEELPSVGSADHARGTCKPCLFLFESMGCKTGYACTFCHVPHDRRTMHRHSKGKRERFRKLLSRVKAENEDGDGVPQQPPAHGGEHVETSPQGRPRNIMSL
mmetsp:Transcript_13094/g.39298  ORF Transcript_13094/g.39298 Transcript_13094/m.39298 type:complete len:251 (+) Transcript_13094:58-810(+)|eukprot:CAMPEP_0175221636 /NCGR_PEP_ID=MMETSP0093-20121207/20408_1 /TAXON_ID=311494 /ORGANISM="Alexandrium monilatum, Strain CCMP3105" /LENGTH=250 /DNA_ID=CAMNT_0016515193 /DNA_START=48 /DNA_END=800 /DNA_ORIENTATION=+